MDSGTALTEAMRESGLRDEDVAVRVGVTAGTVRKWRLGLREPSGPAWQALRDRVDGFAQRIDEQTKAASHAT